jgi:hypothetical protein
LDLGGNIDWWRGDVAIVLVADAAHDVSNQTKKFDVDPPDCGNEESESFTQGPIALFPTAVPRLSSAMN